MNNELIKLAGMSNKYGADSAYVLAGGGNTSFKDDVNLYVKGSGTSLATIKPEDFVVMRLDSLSKLCGKTYPENETERESAVLADMMASRETGETRRPSVEALLHALFPEKFVLHVHPALVNGMTCGKDGSDIMTALFPEAVWIQECRPGYILAMNCKKALDEYRQSHGENCRLAFLENHGVFFAGDTVEEIDALVKSVMDTLEAQVVRRPSDEPEGDEDAAAGLAPAIRMLYSKASGAQNAVVRYIGGHDVLSVDPNAKSATPDHIVYSGAKHLVFDAIPDYDALEKAYSDFVSGGVVPKVVYVAGVGAFACGKTLKEAMTVEALYRDEIKVAVYAESFGGYSPMSDSLIDFIVNWEVESYRAKQNKSDACGGRLCGKVAIVTGAAQGFGLGLAEAMVSEGAYVVIADMNYEGAKKVAERFEGSLAVSVNVTDEESVKNMIKETVLYYGGLDVFVNNAGIVRAGSLEEMTKQNFELVTSVDYTAFFICTKYATVPMKIQHTADPERFFDIIEINSKSGLSGSNKNFAYAGAKFGGIGLTQSFAMELAPYNIKCNAICPGNFLDGPLWSDPVKGLFVQYLNAGKVPGAKTVDDVRKYYESKVPLNRGCRPLDVARALFYIIEQEYETGQALPVTGGQEMLK